MNLTEKLEVARQLEKLRVDVIEAGFAFASPGDAAAVRAIAGVVREAAVCSLARAREQDIDAAYDAVRTAVSPRIHVFLATSPMHRQYKLRMSKEQVLERTRAMVRYAKHHLGDIEFSPEDAGRTELPFLAQVVSAAVEEGATTINIPDTVGYLLPEEVRERLLYLREHVPGIEKVTLSTHVHNDLGMATANSLAAIEAGARQVECTLNGIGERAGNAAMEEVVMAIKTRRDHLGVECRVDTTGFYRASRLLSTITGVKVSPTKPIVGANAFLHESGIHQHGVLNDPSTYEIMTPASVGIPQTAMVLGKHSGRHALEERLEVLGFHLSQSELDRVFEKFKQLADKKKTIKDRDLEALIGVRSENVHNKYQLKDFVINSGNIITSTAVIKVVCDGAVIEKVATADGPVYAALNAVNKIVRQNFILDDYSLNALTEGKDAQAEAMVKIHLAGAEKDMVTGRGISTDIIEASIRAYLNGINRYYDIHGFQED